MNDQELFAHACSVGDVSKIRKLISMGVKPNDICLFEASKNNHIDIVRILLEYPLDSSNTLDIVIDMDNIDIFKLLIDKVDFELLPSIFITACEHSSIKIIKFLLKYPYFVPPNDSIITATENSDILILELLLADHRIDPTIRNNQAIIISPDYSIFKLLLDDGRSNPLAQNSLAIIYASRNGNTTIVEDLLSLGADPSVYNNEAIILACKYRNLDVIKILLSDPRVNPADRENIAIITASMNNNEKVLKLLLSNDRIDPSDQNNLALRSAIRCNQNNIIELLSLDMRTYFKDVNFFQIEVIRKRRIKDRHFELIRYVDDPIELLMEPRNKREIIYIFNSMDVVQWNDVFDSIITDEELSEMLGILNDIYINYPSINWGKRNKFIVLHLVKPKILMKLSRLDMDILKLIQTLPEIPINLQSMLYNLYKTTNLKFIPTERNNISDIIIKKDLSLLREYILNGGYMPYSKHEKSRIIIDLDEEDEKFIKTYYFNESVQNEYINSLNDETKELIDWYVNSDNEYEIFNKKLRIGDDLTDFEMDNFMLLFKTIIESPVINNINIIYRGIDIKENIKFNEGDTMVWKSFTSCSPIREISDNFSGGICCLFIIICPERSIGLNITNLKKSENEIILPPGSKFKFISKGPENIIVIRYIGYETNSGIFYF